MLTTYWLGYLVTPIFGVLGALGNGTDAAHPLLSSTDWAHPVGGWVLAASPATSPLAAAEEPQATPRIQRPREKLRVTHEGKVWDVRFSPNGAYLATASDDDTAQVWDIENSIVVARIEHAGNVRHVRFSPDGELVATAGSDGFACNMRGSFTGWSLVRRGAMWPLPEMMA